MTIEQSLLKRREIDPSTGCWKWIGGKSEGRGKVWFRNKVEWVARVSAYLYLGLDLDNSEQQALHKTECKDISCFNPNHLYIGTPQDNVDDRIKVGKYRSPNSMKTHCKRGHEFSSTNTIIHNGMRECRECKLETQRKRRKNGGA